MILYEICTIERFPRVQDFLSYCRLVKPGRESNGKLLGHAGGKIGNAHLKWIFGELATTFLRANPPAQQLHERLKKRYRSLVPAHSKGRVHGPGGSFQLVPGSGEGQHTSNASILQA